MFKASQLVKLCQDIVGMPYWYGTCVYICTSCASNQQNETVSFTLWKQQNFEI